MKRFWPKSLLAQLMLLVVLALFVAQAINFALLMRANEQLRFAEAAGPLVGRIIDTVDRLDGVRVDRPYRRGRRQVQIDNESAVSRDGLPRLRGREAGLMGVLQEAGIPVRTVEIGESEVGPRRRFNRRQRRNPARRDRPDWLRVSVELENGEWLNGWLPMRPRSFASIGIMLAQTLILYLIVLVALFLFARRLSGPLRRLTAATRNFDPASPGNALPVSGPNDISSLIEAHNAMRVRTGEMLNEKDHMLGAIGHDLRTPLAALRIRAENVEDDAERDRMVETIEDMNTTLEDILSLARLGRSGVEEEQLDLTALVDSAIQDFRDVGAPVTLADGERLVIDGRPNLLKRAIRNLIDNAVRYGESAAVRAIADKDRALVFIDDNGPGIPPDQIEAVFEPFARLDDSRNRESGGTGLGLALAKAIVSDHGGILQLENRSDGGLRATLDLPLSR